ncbi:protein DA1 [Micromonospora sp. WMMD882]|uniref:protein DA1 n=1 Tax=Micromonospora sp. WMMD882 TaxID=3015151 RepID=UPI00248B7E2F|nr:protein DA1 [Micromonospora sp. WMMD882]WBB80604.1 protein DA1 [Micromonospora sp. WMMD882]
MSLHGETTCVGHPVRVRCVFCGRPDADPRPAGWQPFDQTLLRCPTCLVDAVETPGHLRRWLPVARARLAETGVTLPTRVRVRLVGPAVARSRLPTPHDGLLLGLTELVTDGHGRTRATGIAVVAGLPPVIFGRTVAHEIGHAWLAQHGYAPVAPPVAEGICELFAYAWLRRWPAPVAERLRDQMRANPDPVYGDGFRAVHAAVTRHGLPAVLDAVARTGRLPPPGTGATASRPSDPGVGTTPTGPDPTASPGERR